MYNTMTNTVGKINDIMIIMLVVWLLMPEKIPNRIIFHFETYNANLYSIMYKMCLS